jgi:riboflavin kinase
MILFCPTANLSDDALVGIPADLTNGIYFGYARIFDLSDNKISPSDAEVFPMVMSLGWNPFYKNTKLTTV